MIHAIQSTMICTISRKNYCGGLHKPRSFLKNENLSLLRGLVNISATYFSVSMKFKIISFFSTSSLKNDA